MDEIVVRATVGLREYRWATYFNLFFKSARIPLLFILAVGMTGLGLFIAAASSSYMLRYAQICFGACLASLPLMLVALEVQLRRAIGSDSTFFGKEYNYRLNGEGISLKAGEIDNFFAWGQFHRIYETRRMFMMFYGHQVLILPKRDIGEAALELIRGGFLDWMGDRFVLRGI